MSTAARTVVGQVRDVLRDYGDGFTALAAAAGDTIGTLFYVEDVGDITPGMFLQIDDEVVRVGTTYPGGSPPSVSIARGQRGTTAATHISGSMVTLQPIWTNVEILRALNQAQDSAFPALYQSVDDSSTTIASGTYEYTVPVAMGYLCQVWVESGVGTGLYNMSRMWGRMTSTKIILEDANRYPGRKLRFVGYGRFSAMTLSGNLDAAFPDTIPNAIEYLVVKASSNLLKERQAALGRRDSFIGVTDSFQQAQPFMSTLSAKELDKHATSLMNQCRMPRIPEFVADPSRVYWRS
jgi:hypothetical protein